MRQIERDTLRAIKGLVTGSRKNPLWRKQNMIVVRTVVPVVSVLLFGNCICRINADTGAVTVTLAGWPTRTTRSRVNALIRGLVQDSAHSFHCSRGDTYIHDGDHAEIADYNAWYNVGVTHLVEQ